MQDSAYFNRDPRWNRAEDNLEKCEEKLKQTQKVLSQAMYAMEGIYAEYMALHPNHTTNLPCFDHVMKLVSDTRKMENALKGK